MFSMQLSCCRASSSSSFSHRSSFLYHDPPLPSSFLPKNLRFLDGSCRATPSSFNRRIFIRVVAMSKPSSFKMNLNEYMVTLDRPLGIRFAASADGKIFVHSLKKGGNAEKSRIVLVGDILKKASTGSSGGRLAEVKEFGDAQKMLRETDGSFAMVLERPPFPFPVQQLNVANDLDIIFNRGRVPFATWNRNILVSSLRPTSEANGNSGFAVFSPKAMTSQGWKYLSDQNGSIYSGSKNTISQLVCIFSDEESRDAEWAHGSFPLEEYIKALDRSKGELIYNHSLGMRYSKITEQIYVGSCLQTEADVETLANIEGVTAILNFQSASECANWGINSDSLNDACRRSDILMINYPIREVDTYDLRKKLPFCAGLLLRLLRKNLRIYVTCTTGFDRSPACVISYLHWMQDTSLHDACNFVTGLHPCRPNRAAVVWATWDLISMMEKGRHDGRPTHVLTFVWNGKEGEDVYLVGDFTGNWKEPIKATHKGGSRYEAEVKLLPGKYRYKFIISGQWRHSTSSPTESDEHGNTNNFVVVGDTASVKPSFHQQTKDSTIVKVIERPLTEQERVMLAKAARCATFSICPVRLSPK